MQKIKNIFKVISDKEFLIKVMLIQIIILLFVITMGELEVTIKTNRWQEFKISGSVDTDVSGYLDTRISGNIDVDDR